MKTILTEIVTGNERLCIHMHPNGTDLLIDSSLKIIHDDKYPNLIKTIYYNQDGETRTDEHIIQLVELTFQDLLNKIIELKKELKTNQQTSLQKSDIEIITSIKHSPLPIHIEIINSSNVQKKAVLFGFGRYYDEKNYGSDTDIIITGHMLEYREILCESAFYPFETMLIRLMSSNIQQINMDFYIVKHKSGSITTIPVKTNAHYLTQRRLQLQQEVSKKEKCKVEDFIKTVNEIPIAETIDSSTHIELTILPSTSLCFIIFKKK